MMFFHCPWVLEGRTDGSDCLFMNEAMSQAQPSSLGHLATIIVVDAAGRARLIDRAWRANSMQHGQ